MKNLIALLAFVMMSQAYAQTSQPAQQVAPAPVQQVAPVQQTAPIVVAPPAAPAAPVEATANAPASSPIYIMNNQHLQGYQGTNAVQDAPTTVVQEAPVKASASATLRKEREGAEAATEDGIVQTLEKARIEDEVRRRDKFNAALAPAVAPAIVAPVATQQAQQATTSANAVVNAPNAQNVITNTTAVTEQKQNETVVSEPVVEVKPHRKPVIIEDETPKEENVEVRSEVHAAIAETAAPVVNPTQYYIGAQVGTQSYPDAANVRGKYVTGVNVGMITPDRFVIEGGFTYGKADVDDLIVTGQTLEMTQYSATVAGKYQLLPGKLRPSVGAVAAYTHRNYAAPRYSYYGGDDSLTKTDAIDAGLEAGVDFLVSGNLSIGADLKYLWNITNKVSGDDRSSYFASPYGYYSNSNCVKYVEDFSYYIASVSAKFSF